VNLGQRLSSSFEMNFYWLPFTPPSLVAYSVLQLPAVGGAAGPPKFCVLLRELFLLHLGYLHSLVSHLCDEGGCGRPYLLLFFLHTREPGEITYSGWLKLPARAAK
jgi:hypothetical protein